MTRRLAVGREVTNELFRQRVQTLYDYIIPPCETFSTFQRVTGDESCGVEGECRRFVSYSITSSARARSDCGTVRPSALAVFMLMTTWNRVVCSTGTSLG